MGLFSKFGKNKQETAGQDSGYYTSADDQAATERARAKRASSADGAAKPRRGRETDDPVLPEKKRARRRLVGAIALALAVAVGLPMLLDSEPRPLASDIEIKIPAKDKPAEAVRAPAASVAASAALDGKEEIIDDVKPARAAAPVAAAPSTAAIIKADNARLEAEAKAELKAEAKAKAEADTRAKAEALAKARAENEAKARLEAEHKREAERKLADAKADTKADTKADMKAETKAERKLAEAKSAAKPAPDAGKAAEDARALAILEGKGAAKPAAAADAGQKFVLQVAALSDQGKVDELRKRLKEAGINSFTQKTPSGEITRVRVGPFTNKEEAEKVRAKLVGMGLSGRLETV